MEFILTPTPSVLSRNLLLKKIIRYTRLIFLISRKIHARRKTDARQLTIRFFYDMVCVKQLRSEKHRQLLTCPPRLFNGSINNWAESESCVKHRNKLILLTEQPEVDRIRIMLQNYRVSSKKKEWVCDIATIEEGQRSIASSHRENKPYKELDVLFLTVKWNFSFAGFPTKEPSLHPQSQS